MTFKDPSILELTPRRVMAFIDGENLVARFEALVNDGRVPRSGTQHSKGVYVWHPTYMLMAQAAHGFVLRTTYYTSAVGSEASLEDLRTEIRALDFPTRPMVQGPWPNRLTPELFKREKSTNRSKGVDIALTVDVLTQVMNDNVDTVLLFTGDGDYVPLVREIIRAGKLVLLSAFSSGLSPQLVRMASDTYVLDGTAFDTT